MNPIQGLSTARSSLPLPPAGPNAARPDGVDFKQMLMESINDVNSMQLQADKAVESLMTGGDVDPAEVLTAVQKADLGFRLMLQMRNKVMAAYQEIKDIRV
ncbi:MAG: flagellar hook-basal body complex protein FliE [Pirellulales bacterium]|nr:flagellar hook-basal body complex protein FliE [Pirellulales bacterium]MBX3434192.1 flagellar hook-basal body complex protein FliE [Pirellulales bacterium]